MEFPCTLITNHAGDISGGPGSINTSNPGYIVTNTGAGSGSYGVSTPGTATITVANTTATPASIVVGVSLSTPDPGWPVNVEVIMTSPLDGEWWNIGTVRYYGGFTVPDTWPQPPEGPGPCCG